MRYTELLLYLKLKHQRSGNKYLLLAVGGPVKFAETRCPKLGEESDNEEMVLKTAPEALDNFFWATL